MTLVVSVGAALAFVGLSGIPGAVDAGTIPPPPSGWRTVWSDTFSGSVGSAPSSANWLYDTGTSYPGGASHWGTGEVETMTRSTNNVYLDGHGHLVIRPVYAHGSWTSGRIETRRDDFEAPAGGEMEITASIEQPNPAEGLGYWPAFWALGAAARPVGATNWPRIGELDILEDINGLSEVSHTFHCGTNPGGPCHEGDGLGSGLLACAGCQNSYHTYSVIVDRTNAKNEQLRFYTDGELQYHVSESQVGTSTWKAAVDHGFFVIFDVAMGGGYPDGICGCTSPSPSTTSGAGMHVAYVAVYETGKSPHVAIDSTRIVLPTAKPVTVPVRLTCTAASCSGSVWLDATSGSSERLASAAYEIARGATTTVRLQLTSAGRMALADVASRPLTGMLTATVNGGEEVKTSVIVS